MTLQPNEYRCAACGGIFTKTASESEVVAEYERYFGTFRPAEVAVVCDDCFNRMHPETHPHEVIDRCVNATALQLGTDARH